jgi:hypothetical protein
MNRKGFALVIILIIIAIFVLIGIVISLKLETTNQTSINPSTTTSPQPCTLDANGLPPDPGSLGEQTLAGIDCNHNGVRDDVERLIASFDISTSSKMTLEKEAINIQGFILGTPTEGSVISSTLESIIIDRCFRYQAGSHYQSLTNTVEFAMLNTSARLEAFFKSGDQAFTTVGLPDGAAACQAIQ